MAASQCLDDLPDWRTPLGAQHLNVKELYNERHRLALEELIAGGLDSFMAFLNREKIPNFLSEDEIKRITRAAVVPRSVSLMGDETVLETSTGGTLDCSSVTYFPEVSDVEAPVLEIGWPAFTAGSYRGVTRAVAHFQPSYGECIYSCKEAVRRMIKGAKEVIAIVTDSLTDLDIFKDLQEACTRRRIPVYILLDQSNLPSFQQMCKNLDVQLDDLRLMRVRTIAGSTYYMRSGARITGKVHERFMLVDGNRVATGSYRFNWTDGKINSSNLIELSGQITENFDEEFRILYAQSLPLNARGPPSARNSGIYDHLLKPFATPPPQLPRAAVPEPLLQVCLTSTPTRAQGPDLTRRKRPEDGGGKCSAVSNSSTLGEDWIEQELRQEVLITDDPPCVQKLLSDHSTNTSAMDLVITPALPSCHISTQTSCLTHDSGVQTDMSTLPEQTKAPFCTSTSSTQTSRSISNSSGSHSSNQEHHPVLKDQRPPIRRGIPAPDSNLRECFRKLTKERQYHYSTIRSKLDHMVSMLSNRRELVDLTNLALAPSPHRVRKNQQDGRQAQAMIDNTFMGTWPRSRCLH